MSFKGIDRVSLLTLEGRVVVPFILGSYFDERFKLPRGKPTSSSGMMASGSCW